MPGRARRTRKPNRSDWQAASIDYPAGVYRREGLTGAVFERVL